ncbi:RipA family octameric membrane protein [Lacisediminihabitans sp.]|uniref:RipA family octameric membrane protein n=1 Tax=Lacisediminihabitans sp. TaxID=2787631 RepID=UPI003BB84F18
MYKMAVEMADRVSARRGQANQFYLAVETLLLGIPASITLLLSASASAGLDPWVTLVLGICGLAVSTIWWMQLRSYRDLNTAKFKVINKIEADYFEVRPFSDEWAHLKHDENIKRWRGRYAELGTVERVMPAVFAVLYLALIVIGFL